MKIINYIFFLLLFFFIINNINAQKTSEYIINKELYTNADGLPSREITYATQDNYGYMWFATRNGLCRFDGIKFQVFNSSNSKLYYNNIKSIYFDGNEGVIVNFNSKTGYYIGLVNELQVINTKSLEIKVFDEYYNNCPFKENQITDIVLFEKSGNLLFRLSPYDNMYFDTIRSYKTYQLTNSSNFKEFDCHITKSIFFQKNSNNKKFVIEHIINKVNYKNSAFLINMQNEILQNSMYDVPTFHIYNDEINHVFGCRNELGKFDYYFMDKDAEIHQFNESTKLKNHLFNKDFSYHHIAYSNSTLEIDNRNIWRLVHIGDQDVTLNDTLDNDSFNRAKILHAFKDKLNNYWFCTTEGIVKVKIEKRNFAKHLTLKQYPILENHSVRGILKNNSEILVSMPGGIVIEKNNKFNFVPNQRNFGIIKHHRTVLSSGGNSIIQFSGIDNQNKIHHFETLGEVWSLLSIDTNNIIAIGIEQIIKYNIVTKSQIPIVNKCKARPNACYRVVKEKNGNYLLVGESGVFVLNKRYEIENYFSTDTSNKQYYLPINHINDVHIDLNNSNIYWLATAYDGLFIWNRKANTFIKYGLSNGFLSEVCYRIEEDAYNNLWVSTDFGIAKFNKNTREATVYTEKDGIAHNEFNRASSYVDDEGIMYFGGIDGYTTFNPKNFISNKKEIPPLVIAKIRSYNIETNKEEDKVIDYWNDHYLTLSKNQKNLIIDFTLLDYEIRQHQYAYQIIGYNNQWQYTNEGKISINGLPYGDYIIAIKAQNSSGIWLTENMIKIPIEVIRPYYETWWFYSLAALFIIALMFLIFFLIYKAKIKNLQRLADLRLSIASDLHDQVGGLLNKSAIQSELIQTKHKVSNETLSKIAMNNRTALSSMRDIIWNLDPRNDNSESLVDRMNDYAQKMLADDFDYTIDIQSIESVELNHEIRQNLNMIFKESINNIVKHAPNSRVKIELKIVSHTIILTIFNSGAHNLFEKRSGQGLWNMEMRAKKIKGHFSISFDDGVEICVTVPISH